MSTQQEGGPKLSRRQLLQAGMVGAAGLATRGRASFAAPAARRQSPNLLFINTDQQFNDIIAAHGCPYVQTPNLDRLVARGLSFRQSYSANPLCCPERAVWLTGRPGSENGAVGNDSRPILADIPDLGQWFRAHGYESVHAGKWHVFGRLPWEVFHLLTMASLLGEDSDSSAARAVEGFLLNYRGDKPFFLSLSFTQPHDICYSWMAQCAGADALPYPALADELPPAWDNFGYDPREPETIRRDWRKGAPGPSSEPGLGARYYRWVYHRQVEMVDAQIGRVLDAVEDAGLAENTVIVFTSDHGEMMRAHDLTGKTQFYEESVRVPLVISWPGHLTAGVQDRTRLVSGLDIAPTLCDFAGIPAPPKMRGRSLRPLAEGRNPEWREFLVSETRVTGRMICTPEYKYITYRGEATDQLFDLRTDRGEMHNLAPDGKHAGVVGDLKKRLADWEGHLEVAAGALEPQVSIR